MDDIASLPSGPNQKYQILDIGCGLGSFSTILERLPNSTYIGIDLSGEAIRKARERFPVFKDRAEFLQIDTLDFIQKSKMKVDIVIDSASLQHHFASDEHQSWNVLMQHLSQFLQSGVLYTQWASSKNLQMEKTFSSFTGFEQILKILRDFFVVDVKMIKEVKFLCNSAENDNPVSVVEYIAAIRNKQ
jgi:SAM-dependent methyltransferase